MHIKCIQNAYEVHIKLNADSSSRPQAAHYGSYASPIHEDVHSVGREL
jgi:hypothetical protein